MTQLLAYQIAFFANDNTVEIDAQHSFSGVLPTTTSPHLFYPNIVALLKSMQ